MISSQRAPWYIAGHGNEPDPFACWLIITGMNPGKRVTKALSRFQQASG